MFSTAMENAGASSDGTSPQLIAVGDRRSGRKSDFGISPTVATSSPRSMVAAVAMMMPTSEAGTTAFHFFGKNTISSTTNSAMTVVVMFGWKPSVP